ncbi:MAG: aspartyl/asparaginyl beta-hydroxylase domain-containing protein [Proteobacteria bacterium]|nr:aspartyl/asparaginyl beta-hydroxylase domain-containing protein [Pseudomonadota bacterium]
MTRVFTRKRLRKGIVAVAALGGALYFVPFLAIFFIATGILDVLRNERKDGNLFERYFLGNGVTAWFLSPINLSMDLLCYRNKRIYGLEDFSEECRKEIEEVLSVFVARKEEIVAHVDRAFESGRRGMLVYRWYGRQYDEEIAEFNKPFKYLRTIAVSVFEGNESTSFHFGPLRLTLRVLYNLTPVESEEVFIECGRTKHYWHKNPLFIFDDTLMHRSVNQDAARRYCVFMDVIRPSPVTALLSVLLAAISAMAQRTKGVFYRNWKMLGANGATRGAKTKS